MERYKIDKTFSTQVIIFICAKCRHRKTLVGRKRYQIKGRDSDGRKTFNYQCADCVRGEK